MTLTELQRLLSHSLTFWSVDACVKDPHEGLLVISTNSKRIHISRAPLHLPFRWLVQIGDRRRTASSVTGLLRHLRLELDADYQPGRLQFVSNAPEKPPL